MHSLARRVGRGGRLRILVAAVTSTANTQRTLENSRASFNGSFARFMRKMMDEVPEIQLCEVSNEVEAAMVVNLLREDGIPARSDATPAMSLFGGLPFEPGHAI